MMTAGSLPLAVVAPWLSAWLTPVWLLSVGVLIAMVVLGAAWGVSWLAARNVALAAARAVREGVLFPVLIVALVLAAFALLGFPVVRHPGQLLAHVARVPFTGRSVQHFTIPRPAEATDAAGAPTGKAEETKIGVSFRSDEIRRLTLTSDQKLTIVSEPGQDALASYLLIRVAGDAEPTTWRRRGRSAAPLPMDQVDVLYVRNLGDDKARLTVDLLTEPPTPEVSVVPLTALATVGLFLVYLAMLAAFPKVSAVALATSKSAMAQPIYPIIIVVGAVLLWLFMVLPYFTLGEDIKMLKGTGVEVTMVMCIFLAVWFGSASVADEIEGRTALTVLSKPIGRVQFVIGKFFGIAWPLALVFVLLGVLLMVLVSYKVIHEVRESTTEQAEWFACHFEMFRTVPGLVLAFMETAVIVALSVAISTRLPLMANFLICTTIYVLGHLTPLLVQQASGAFEPVAFVGQLTAAVLPVLQHFNVNPAIAGGAAVPASYLGSALVYCMLYSVFALLLALVLFEDRDLA